MFLHTSSWSHSSILWLSSRRIKWSKIGITQSLTSTRTCVLRCTMTWIGSTRTRTNRGSLCLRTSMKTRSRRSTGTLPGRCSMMSMMPRILKDSLTYTASQLMTPLPSASKRSTIWPRLPRMSTRRKISCLLSWPRQSIWCLQTEMARWRTWFTAWSRWRWDWTTTICRSKEPSLLGFSPTRSRTLSWRNGERKMRLHTNDKTK